MYYKNIIFVLVLDKQKYMKVQFPGYVGEANCFLATHVYIVLRVKLSMEGSFNKYIDIFTQNKHYYYKTRQSDSTWYIDMYKAPVNECQPAVNECQPAVS